jgi:hypothetical protein
MIHQKPTFRDGAVHKDRWLFVCDGCRERFESALQLRYHRRTDCPINKRLPWFFSVKNIVRVRGDELEKFGGVAAA